MVKFMFLITIINLFHWSLRDIIVLFLFIILTVFNKYRFGR